MVDFWVVRGRSREWGLRRGGREDQSRARRGGIVVGGAGGGQGVWDACGVLGWSFKRLESVVTEQCQVSVLSSWTRLNR